MSGETTSLRVLVPSALTAANIACGFLAMLASAAGRFEAAVYLLVAAIFLDLADGGAARLLKATSRFGQELDSLSDALSFCAAPAFLVYLAVLEPLGAAGVAASVVFLLAGVLRLARFNVTSDAHAKAKRTLGCPTPIAAGYLMVLALMRQEVAPVVAAGVVVVMALLMVSRLPLPEIGSGPLTTFTLLVGICSYLAVVWKPGWLTIGWWNLWNVVILLAARIEGHRLAASDADGEPARTGS